MRLMRQDRTPAAMARALERDDILVTLAGPVSNLLGAFASVVLLVIIAKTSQLGNDVVHQVASGQIDIFQSTIMLPIVLVSMFGNITMRLRFHWACAFSSLTIAAIMTMLWLRPDLPAGLAGAILIVLAWRQKTPRRLAEPVEGTP